jgi:adenylate cyclase
MTGVDPLLDSEHTSEPTKASKPSAEEVWRGILLGTDPRFRDSHAFFARLPGNPRCYMCSAPFKGPGSIVARRMGRRPWAKNPHYCNGCFSVIETQHGGAEVECSLLFADVRGSTTIAEGMSPTEFRRLLDRFYDAAAGVIHDHGAILDKFVGDEAVAIFIPALSGELHAARAVAAGRALLRVTGHGDRAARGCRSGSGSTPGSPSSAPWARGPAAQSPRSATP